MVAKSRSSRDRRSNPFLPFYQTEIAPLIAPFEARRKKGLQKFRIATFAILAITTVLVLFLEAFWLVPVGLLTLATTLIVLSKRMKNTLGVEVWDTVRPKLFKYLKVAEFKVADEEQSIKKADVGGINFFPSLAKMKLSETYKGVYKNHPITFCGITAYELRNKRGFEVDFEGVYLTFELPPSFDFTSSFIITPSPESIVRELFDFEIRGHETVILPHTEFSQQYRVRASNEKELSKILTADLLDFFAKIARATTYHARLCVDKGTVYCCIPTQSSPFDYEFSSSLPDFKQMNTLCSDFSLAFMAFNKIMY